MEFIPLRQDELDSIRPGEPVTLATVLLVFTCAILAIVVYKLFFSKNGKVVLPGGYQFIWSGR